MNKEQEKKFTIVIMLVFFILLGSGIWVTSWYLSAKLILSSFLVIGAGTVGVSVLGDK